MLKNKKVIYVLLPLTFLIWGKILYKVFGGHVSTDNLINKIQVVDNKKDKEYSDTFSIIADYRDPFLGKMSLPREQQTHVIQKTKTPPKPNIIPQQVKWPSLSYNGIIQNQKDGKQLAIIQVNGKENMLKPGEEIAGIQLVKVYKDSIEVSYGNVKKTVIK